MRPAPAAVRHPFLRFLCLPVLLFCGTGFCVADTTWVSGAVSGEWTREGSPYVIAALTWVNRPDTLTVWPGVEVVLPLATSNFRPGWVCRFWGSAGDSVTLRLAHPAARLSFDEAQPGRRFEFAYTRFTGYGFEHVLMADSTFIRHCAYAYEEAMPPTVRASHLGGYVAAEQSALQWFACTWARIDLHAVTLKRGLIVTDGDLTLDSVARDPSVAAEPGSPGIIAGTILGGGRITAHRLQGITLSHTGQSPATPCAVSIAQSALGFVRVDDGPVALTLTDSEVGQLDLCRTSGIVERCILGPSQALIQSNLTFKNNTFVWADPDWTSGPAHFLTADASSTLTLNSNLFWSRHAAMAVVPATAPAPRPAYNLVWGLTNPWPSRILGPGNLQQDPRFDPNAPPGTLQAPSPAIDHGDVALTDPDGSRRDIGARWWDHRVDHPPIISTPDTIETGWGEWLDLDLAATDDGPVRLEFPRATLPAWLAAPQGLDEAAVGIYHGRVPYGSRSFTLPVVAVDGAGQRDTDTLRVLIHPSSTLADSVSGTLRRDHSPYIARHDVYLPAGDTLRVEPGVRIQLDSLATPPSLIVRGTLLARGTAQDSIHIEARTSQPWYALMGQGPAARLELAYVSISGGSYPLRCQYQDPPGRVQLDHCRIAIPDSTPVGFGSCGIQAATDTALVRNCGFWMGGRLSLAGPVLIEGCTFAGNRSRHGHVICSGGFRGAIRHCTFEHLNSAAISLWDDAEDVLIERCRFRVPEWSAGIGLSFDQATPPAPDRAAQYLRR